MVIRSFEPDDLAAVYSIQVLCSQTAQWREDDYFQLARDPLGTILVAEHETAPGIVGFAAFHRVLDEAELRNIAVHPAYRRQGIASALLSAGARTLHSAGARRVFLEVRASNQPALALYAATGFEPLRTRRAYYQGPIEDALVMACTLDAAL